MSSLQRVREKNLQSMTESKTKAWVRGGTVLSTLAALGALAFFGWKRQRRKSDLPKTRTNAHLQAPWRPPLKYLREPNSSPYPWSC